ncbi:MAG: hypothetical protein ACP5OO_12825 [Chloroflexia bacterium]
MKRYSLATALVLTLLLLSGTVTAQDSIVLRRSVLAGGGAQASSGSISLGSTLGQPLTGLGTAENTLTLLRSGFWGTFVQHLVFLPATLRHNLFYFEGPWEREENNDFAQANGPLRAGRDYYGCFNDPRDYFYIYAQAGRITAMLSNCSIGRGNQFALYDANGNKLQDDLTPEDGCSLDYTGPAGRYYLRLYTAQGFTPWPCQPAEGYTLRVSYP